MELTAGPKELMARQFPFLDDSDIEQILGLCEKNGGLTYLPKQNPVCLFAHYRFYPSLIHAVENQDFDVLRRVSLKKGPIVYIAAFVVQKNGYVVMRRLLDSLNAYAFAFHRYKKERDRWRFGIVKNPRFGKAAQIQ